MKLPASRGVAILLPVAMLLARAALAAPEAPLKLPSFATLASQAAESVSVTLDANLLGIAAAFLDPAKAEDAAARELIAGLRGIYVRSYSFDRDFAFPSADIELVRKQLSAPGWQPLVSVHGRNPQEDVDIYISIEQGRANGLAIIAIEPREFTIVNIVGSIDLEKLHRLQGKFGIPRLPEEATHPSP
jgi:hypothetical protein